MASPNKMQDVLNSIARGPMSYNPKGPTLSKTYPLGRIGYTIDSMDASIGIGSFIRSNMEGTFRVELEDGFDTSQINLFDDEDYNA